MLLKSLKFLILSVLATACYDNLREGVIIEETPSINQLAQSTISFNSSSTSDLRQKFNWNWGLNGHLTGGEYDNINDEIILEHLGDVGITHYRTDIGLIHRYTADLNEDALSDLEEILSKAQPNNVTIVPVVLFYTSFFEEFSDLKNFEGIYKECGSISGDEYDISKVDQNQLNDRVSLLKSKAIDLGESIGDGIQSINTGKSVPITHIQLGNEITQIGGRREFFFKGNDIEKKSLNPCLMRAMAEIYNGLIEGIRAKSELKIIINQAAEYNIGFYDILKEYNVEYDIIGVNWYNGLGKSIFGTENDFTNKVHLAGSPYDENDYLNTLNIRYDKEIWITEINRQGGVGSFPNEGFPEDDQNNSQSRQTFDKYFSKLDGKEYVTGFFFYELLSRHSNTVNNHSIAFISNNAITNRPIGEYYSDVIENGFINLTESENRSKNELLVISLFKHHFGRYPESQSSLEFNSSLIDQHGFPTYVSDVFNTTYSDESNLSFIANVYRIFLDREPDYSGLNHHNNLMKAGSSREEIIRRICNSNEFYSKSGGSDESFVERLYQKLLERESDEMGLNHQLENINLYGRQFVTMEMMESEEYLRLFIKKTYLKYLERLPDSEGWDYLLKLMKNGISQEQLIRNQILLSNEFINSVSNNFHQYPVFQF